MADEEKNVQDAPVVSEESIVEAPAAESAETAAEVLEAAPATEKAEAPK